MGKNVRADDERAHNVEVMDELGQDIVKGQIDAISKEKENFEIQRQRTIDGKERFLKQWIRDQKLYQLMMDNFEMLPERVTMKYELLPEFWELKKQQFEDKYTQDKHMTEAKLADYDRQLEAYDMEIQTAVDKLKELGENDE